MNHECVSPNRVKESGGYLHLQVAAETCRGQNIAGALVESNPFNNVPGHTGFEYTEGYVEWKAFVPASEDGELADWPALWSVAPHGGNLEIDTFEGLHGKANFHFFWHPEEFQEGGPSANQTYAGAWHYYGVDWEHGVLTYYYDGVEVGQLANPRILAHTEPQYLIMDFVAPGKEPYKYGGQLAYSEMKIDYVRVWEDPTPPPPPNPNIQVSTVETHGGEVLAFGHNAAGELLEFRQSPGGVWEVSNVTSLSNGQPDISGTPSAIVMGSGELLVFADSPSGELIGFVDGIGGWHAEDVSGESNGDPHITGAPSATRGRSGEPLVFADSPSGHLLSFAATGVWTVNDVSALSNGDPPISGSPSALTSNGEVLVFADSPSGELIGFVDAGNGWHAEDVSGESNGDPHITGAPSATRGRSGEPVVFADSPSGELISFAATGVWTANDVSGLSNGDPHISGAPSATLTAHDELLAFADSPSGELIGFVDAGGGWHAEDVSGESAGDPHIIGAPAAMGRGSGEPLVFAADPTGELLEFAATGSWNLSDLTALTGDSAFLSG